MLSLCMLAAPPRFPRMFRVHPAQIIQGELTDVEGLSKAIEGQDVIVSLLGPAGTVSGTPYTDAYRLIFPLMKRWGVKRILAMGTASISDPEDGFSILAFLGVVLVRILANSAYKDIVSVGNTFDTEATKNELDWTIFRLGFLSDGAPQTCKAGYVAKNGWALKNQRADIASWLIEEVEKDDSEWIRKRPALWS